MRKLLFILAFLPLVCFGFQQYNFDHVNGMNYDHAITYWVKLSLQDKIPSEFAFALKAPGVIPPVISDGTHVQMYVDDKLLQDMDTKNGQVIDRYKPICIYTIDDNTIEKLMKAYGIIRNKTIKITFIVSPLTERTYNMDLVEYAGYSGMIEKR